MAVQFETGMQNLVYQMDAGSGRKVIQTVLFALFAFALAALYTFANFQGLKNARAMEQAQLARNLAEQGQLTTRCVRPLSMARVAERSAAGHAAVMAHPDLYHPPLWPAVLAGVYRMTGIPKTGIPTTAQVFGADYVPVAVNHLLTILSALLVWLIACKLFDSRVGVLSLAAFLLSDLVWRQSLAGTDMGLSMLFTLGAVYAALWAADPPVGAGPVPEAVPLWRWLVPLAVSALLTAAAFLTRYAAGTVALVILLYLGTSRCRRPWLKAGLFLLLALLAVLPWMLRNLLLSGNLFGLVFHEMLADTYLFPGDTLARTIRPELPDAGALLYAVQIKMMANLRTFFTSGFGLAGTGLLLGLFSTMYFHRFVRPSSRRLRWCLLPAVLLLVLFASAYGEESLRALTLYWPLAIPYAWAFFLVLLDRLQFEARFFAAAIVSVVLFLTGLPLLVNVLPPRTGLPYPPYFHRYIGWVASMLEPGECMMTDIPWATAWYGGQTSILLPDDIDGYYEIDQDHQTIAMIYFTTVTRNKPWVRDLADPTSPEYSWYRIFASGKVPPDFPLAHARFIAGSDQYLLSDRPRW